MSVAEKLDPLVKMPVAKQSVEQYNKVSNGIPGPSNLELASLGSSPPSSPLGLPGGIPSPAPRKQPLQPLVDK